MFVHGFEPCPFAAFSPDGRSIITTGERPDNTARLWAARPKGDTRRLEGHLNPVRKAAFSPDGQTIATASDDKSVRLWDVGTGEEITRLKGHTGRVNAVAFNPDGQTLASAGFDRRSGCGMSSLVKKSAVLKGTGV